MCMTVWCSRTLLPEILSVQWDLTYIWASSSRCFPIPQCQKGSWAYVFSWPTWLSWNILQMCWPKETYIGPWQIDSVPGYCSVYMWAMEVTACSYFHLPWKGLGSEKRSVKLDLNLCRNPSESVSCSVKVGNSGSSSHSCGDGWQIPFLLVVAYPCFSVVIGCVFTEWIV